MAVFIEELFEKPDVPKHTGNEKEWVDCQQRIGIQYPIDFIWIVNNYGSGLFCDFLSIRSPFSEDYQKWLEDMKWGRQYLKLGNPDDFLEDVGTAIGNIFPIGNTANGDEIFYYISDPDSNKWMTRFYPTRDSAYLEYRLPIAEYILSVFSGNISQRPFDQFLDSEKFFHSF